MLLCRSPNSVPITWLTSILKLLYSELLYTEIFHYSLSLSLLLRIFIYCFFNTEFLLQKEVFYFLLGWSSRFHFLYRYAWHTICYVARILKKSLFQVSLFIKKDVLVHGPRIWLVLCASQKSTLMWLIKETTWYCKLLTFFQTSINFFLSHTQRFE